MSTIIDPAKLKVVELRAELSKRGLDTKGNKPALVKRLKDALEEEGNQEIPDTSIADTSTEDLDTSQNTDDHKVPENEEQSEQQDESKVGDVQQDEEKSETTDDKPEEKQETSDDQPVVEPEPMESEPITQTETSNKSEPELKQDETPVEENKTTTTNQVTTNEPHIENGEDEPKTRKSRWGNEDDNKDTTTNDAEKVEKNEENEVKGEKRKHSSPSPERGVQRRRSKSPIKEDEPPIDNDKVQLSWYDSDLHLQLDKESFLSAKPYHEGAFGFAWAGVRATHGVNSGKVCYEVKITEELKWEDFSKHYERNFRNQSTKSSNNNNDNNKKQDDKKTTTTTAVSDTENVADKEKTTDDSAENGDAPTTTTAETKSADNDGESANNDNKSMEVDENVENKEKEESTKNVETKEEESKPTTTTEESEEKMEVGGETTTTTTSTEQTENKPQEPPIPTHLFRVGWSILNSKLQLGEDKYSYGYESTGKFVTDKQFNDYGIKFGVGDVVTAFLDINEEYLSITYAVNDEVQPEAIKIEKSELPENFVLFPHVSSRNYAFELNLGSKDEAWFSKPEQYADYVFLDKIENKIAGPLRPESRSECEVILMCGLPASGKTHWVNEYVQANPDKKYTLLGNTQLLEKMTVSGDALKSKYKGRWNVLLDKLQKCLNKLIEIAALRRRNYIIDQTNVFPSAQRRKLRPFEGFKRRAVVVVVGDEEQAKRQSLQEAQGGKDVPDSAVLEMKANMSLPQKGDWIDEVLYVGLNETEAKAQIQKYNTQGKEAGYGGQKRFGGHRDDRHRWQNRRNDYRGGSYRDRNYHRYDRGPPRQNWHPQRPGGWNRDRRDNRGPPSRDWRNRGSSGRDRGSRDNHGGQSSNYRSRNAPSSRGPSGGSSWQQGSGGGGSGSWGGHQGGQSWSGGQPWGGSQGSWNSQSWSQSQSQNQWKYGGGSSQPYGNYSNWNYYSQYPQNWNAQGQTSSTGGASSANQYGQYSQQEWAQYAQQYAQQGHNTSMAPAAPQK